MHFFDISLLSVFCGGLGLGLEAQVLGLGLGVSGLVNITGRNVTDSYCVMCSIRTAQTNQIKQNCCDAISAFISKQFSDQIRKDV